MSKDSLFDLNLWKSFMTAAQCRSFREAGALLGKDASTVGRQVAALEQALGQRLFEPSGRFLKLTPTGRNAWSRMSHFVQAADQTIDDIVVGKTSGTRQLHLLASAGFSNAFLRRAISYFTDLFPGTLFVIESVRQSDSYFDELGRGVDIIVTAQPTEVPGIHSRRVSHHSKICVASPSFVDRTRSIEHPKDLVGLPLAGNSHFAHELQFSDRYDVPVPGVTLDYAIISDNSLFLADWAASGKGVFVGCPATLAEGYIEEHRLQRILADWTLPPLTGWAHYAASEEGRPDSLVPAFIDLLCKLNTQTIDDAMRHMTKT